MRRSLRLCVASLLALLLTSEAASLSARPPIAVIGDFLLGPQRAHSGPWARTRGVTLCQPPGRPATLPSLPPLDDYDAAQKRCARGSARPPITVIGGFLGAGKTAAVTSMLTRTSQGHRLRVPACCVPYVLEAPRTVYSTVALGRTCHEHADMVAVPWHHRSRACWRAAPG